jgi:ribosomal protein L37E
VSDSRLVEADWLYSNAIGGVKLWVRAEDEAHAREVLDDETAAEDGEGVRDPEPDSASAAPCPRCGSDAFSVSTDKRRAFLSWLVIGLPLFPTSRRLICRSCGHAFRRKR